MVKGTIILTIAALVVVTTATASFGKYSGGAGEPNDPYRIATPNDLNDIGNHPEDFNKCFVLVNDINMAGFTYTTAPIAPDTSSTDGFQGIPFTGIFDGNDCNIGNLTIDTAGADNDFLGLFGQIGENGGVKNLGVEDVNITGGYDSWYLGGLCGENVGTVSKCYATGQVTGDVYVGGLVGKNDSDGTLTACHFSGDVTGSWPSYRVGGLVGWNYKGTLTSCYATGQVTGDYVGGLVGRNEEGTLTACYATGQVTGDYVGGLVGSSYKDTLTACYATGQVTGLHFVGGLVGKNTYGTLTSCYAVGKVVGKGKYYGSQIGGLVGQTSGGTLTFCYATGNVTGNDYVGGLVGASGGTISNSYACGSVSGTSDVGGLVGASGGTISNSYACGAVSGTSDVGGLVGYDGGASYTSCFWDSDIYPGQGIGNGSDPNVIGKTTAEMMAESTFTDAGWDFVEVWDIGENQTYPFLRVYPAGDLNHDGIVNFIDVAILADHWLEGTGP
jgi:hypothetical protein